MEKAESSEAWMDELEENGKVEDGEKKEEKKKKKKKKKVKKEKEVDEIISEVRNSSDKDSDSEEVEFWVPPVGERWDFDDGGDRWGSDAELGQESEEENEAGMQLLVYL